MAFPSIRISIGADMSKLKRDLDKGEGIVKSFGKQASRAMEGAIVAAGAFATKLAIDGVKAASDLNETMSKTNVIFGDSAKNLQDWAEANAIAMGQTRQQALDAASTFATFGKQAGYTGDKLVGFSTEFTTLASDLASFNNTSPDDAITALGAALRGESEPIRRYGVLLSEAAIQAKAYSDQEIAGNKKYFSMQGKKEVLNDQGKLLARYKLILEQTTDAQGDFARTSDGLANGQRILNARWEDAKVKIGEALLPAIQDLTKWANGPEGKKFLEDFANGMASAFKNVAENMPGIVQAIKDITTTANNLGVDFDTLLSPAMLKAGLAYKAMPGTPQMKGFAALAVYAAENSNEAVENGDANIFQRAFDWSQKNTAYGIATGLINNEQGVPGSIASSYNEKLVQLGLRPYTVNINVGQATDANATAVAINRSLAKAVKSGVLNQNVTAPSF